MKRHYGIRTTDFKLIHFYNDVDEWEMYKEGKVIAVNAKKNTVLVEGINMITKHTKPSMANQNGGIVQQEGPIDISNVMYVHKGTATRVGFKMDGDKKVRYAKSTGDVID